MSDELPAIAHDDAERAVAKAEEAATRRRWISLVEFVSVAGLIIAALGLWLTWSDRRASEAGRQSAMTREARAKTIVTLAGIASSDGDTITLSDPAHEIGSVEVTFPDALGVRPQTSVLGPRITSAWFADRLLAVTPKGRAHAEGKLPVILASSYWDGDVKRHDSAIYDVVWRTEARFLRGRAVRLVRVTLRDRRATQAKLDAAWIREAARR